MSRDETVSSEKWQGFQVSGFDSGLISCKGAKHVLSSVEGPPRRAEQIMDFLQEATEIAQTIKRTLFPLLPPVKK